MFNMFHIKGNYIKILYYVFYFLGSGMIFFSCKREKKDFIGPEVGIASSNFKIINAFGISDNSINFSTDSNWFNAKFNEHVSWTIKVKGLQSNAEKILKGTSEFIDRSNSQWTGGHSGLYFFQAGEQIVSELSIFGTEEVWYDTSTVIDVKKDFGKDVIVWWDMDQLGVAKNGTVYWFDYYDTGEGLLPSFVTTTQIDAQQLQGKYRSLQGKELNTPVDYYVGGASHSYSSIPYGFDVSLDEVYINFYARRRTMTTSIGVSLVSLVNTDTCTLGYDTGTIKWEGWKLVSIRLSEMKKDSKRTFDFSPAFIRQFGVNLQTYTTTNVETGFDIDFITITKGGPFNPDQY